MADSDLSLSPTTNNNSNEFWFWQRAVSLEDEPHGPVPIAKYSDLPLEVRARCQEELRMERKEMEDNLVPLFQITHSRMRKFFPSYKEVQHRRKWVPYISKELEMWAEQSLEVSDKHPKKQFKKIKLLAEGSHSTLFSAEKKKSKETVVIKRVSNSNQREKENNISEIAFLKLCSHPNIVEFDKAILTEVKSKDKRTEKGYELWMVMEYLKGPSLSILSKMTLEEANIAYFASELLKALNYLHERDFVHRDLNPSNIICTVEGKLKIIDFGLAAYVHDGPRYQMLGQPYYTSPEMINRLGHNCACDIWSLGAVLLECFLHEPPIKMSTVLCLFTICTKGIAHLIPASVSPEGRNFLESCLTIDVSKRATAKELMKHSWVRSDNVKSPDIEVILAANVTLKTLMI